MIDKNLLNENDYRKVMSIYSNSKLDFQRFEFLGDRVLGLALAENLMTRFSEYDEGKLAKIFAKVMGLVNGLMPRNPQYFRRQRYINALAPNDLATVMALLLTEEDNTSNIADVFAPDFKQKIVGTDPFSRFKECQGYMKNEDVVNQMLLVDAMVILPDIFLEKVDRSTMAASIEVRVPFLDNDLAIS